MLDSVGMKNVEEKNKQFLIEKIIHGVEFKNLYQSNPEKNPEIMEIIEANYRIARRVYQHLYYDIAQLFAEYVKSMSSYELQDIDEDIKTNGWGVKNIIDIDNTFELLSFFQLFHYNTGRFP